MACPINPSRPNSFQIPPRIPSNDATRATPRLLLGGEWPALHHHGFSQVGHSGRVATVKETEPPGRRRDIRTECERALHELLTFIWAVQRMIFEKSLGG